MATSIDVAGPPDEAASRAVGIFHKQVSGQWTRKRVPNGLRAALNSRTQTQTAKIFRRAGMLAFLAYHLAHTRRSGKSTLLKFAQLPEATRKEIAERVAALNVHSSVRDFVGKLEVDCQYPQVRLPSFFLLGKQIPQSRGHQRQPINLSIKTTHVHLGLKI